MKVRDRNADDWQQSWDQEEGEGKKGSLLGRNGLQHGSVTIENILRIRQSPCSFVMIEDILSLSLFADWGPSIRWN